MKIHFYIIVKCIKSQYADKASNVFFVATSLKKKILIRLYFFLLSNLFDVMLALGTMKCLTDIFFQPQITKYIMYYFALSRNKRLIFKIRCHGQSGIGCVVC